MKADLKTPDVSMERCNTICMLNNINQEIQLTPARKNGPYRGLSDRIPLAFRYHRQENERLTWLILNIMLFEWWYEYQFTFKWSQVIVMATNIKLFTSANHDRFSSCNLTFLFAHLARTTAYNLALRVLPVSVPPGKSPPSFGRRWAKGEG